MTRLAALPEVERDEPSGLALVSLRALLVRAEDLLSRSSGSLSYRQFEKDFGEDGMSALGWAGYIQVNGGAIQMSERGRLRLAELMPLAIGGQQHE